MAHDREFKKRLEDGRIQKHRIPSTDAIEINEGIGAVRFDVLSKHVLPTGISTWVNLFVVFRQRKKNTNEISKAKISLRKYQCIGEKWGRRQNFNINSVKEAKAILELLRVVYPNAFI
jgi:hypothetical protein